MGDNADLKAEMTALATSLRNVAATVNNMSAKFDDLAGKVERLSPLAPVATKLASLPEKVVSLQATAFESTEQVRALNLALIRLESKHRDGKAPAQEDCGATSDSANGPHKGGYVSPPPPRKDDDDYADPRFHPRTCLEFPTFDGKEDPPFVA